MEADIVQPGHVWIMSKLVDKRSVSVSVKDMIYDLCDSALSYIKSENDLNKILRQLYNCNYIKKSPANMLAGGLPITDDAYVLTEKGMLAFRLQIMRPIVKACDEDVKVKEHLNAIKKTLQSNKINIAKNIIELCLQNAVLIVEFVKCVSI